MITLAPSPFEVWAKGEGYDLTPAVSPCALRQYADIRTQEVFKAWNASARNVAQMVTESTLEPRHSGSGYLRSPGTPNDPP
jgi:hypothetical protein